MRLFYLWYLGTIIFIIPIMLNSKEDNVDSAFTNNQMSDSSTFIFYPNDQCSTVAYVDTVNCGNSKATLIKNPQNLIWCNFSISNKKMYNEAFAGIEIWFKDTNKAIDISNFDHIEINMIALSSDTSSVPFEMHCHSRLKHPEKLPKKDTLPCDDPLKKPNNRYEFSVKYTEFQLPKNNFISTFAINSLTTPRWYKNTVTENFDKGQFYSLCVQTGNPFPFNTDYTIIISSIIFKKNIQTQAVINSLSARKNSQFILVLSTISCILYVMVITLLIRIRYKSKSDKGENKQILIPSASPTNTQPIPTQSFKADNNSNYADTTSTVITDTTGIIIRPTQVNTDTTGVIIRQTSPLPLDEITINVLRKIADNPKLSTDDVAKDNNKDSSTICKKIDRDFGRGVTISKLRLYFTALDIRNKNKDVDCNELHNHANKIITDAHGKLNSYKDLQDISAILQKKCPNDILDFFKKKYGDIQF